MTSPVTDRQISTVLELLADGNPHQFTDLAERAGTNHLNTVAVELRRLGHDVRCWRVPVGRDYKNRPLATWYFRLILEPALATADAPGPRNSGASAAASAAREKAAA